MSNKPKIMIVGIGNMGGSLLKSWLDCDLFQLYAVGRSIPDWLMHAQQAGQCVVNPDVQSVGIMDCVVLAVKPALLSQVCETLRSVIGKNTAVVSVAAGKTLSFLKDITHNTGQVIRVMPNTPSSVKEGMSVAVADAHVDTEARNLVTSLFQQSGAVHWVSEESQMHAVTALSGSGPAYVFHMVEALVQAGCALGLDEITAEKLARQTVIGAGALLKNSPDKTATDLRKAVTSPNGTTHAGVTALMGENPKADSLTDCLKRTLQSAHNRSVEMAG